MWNYMQPLPDEFDILHYVRIADVRKKSDAAAFIIWYTRCEEHIEYMDILKCLY